MKPKIAIKINNSIRYNIFDKLFLNRNARLYFFFSLPLKNSMKRKMATKTSTIFQMARPNDILKSGWNSNASKPKTIANCTFF